MKSFKLLTVLTVLCFGAFLTKSNAQVDVTVNPIGLLFGDLSVGADFGVTESFSVEGSIGVGGGKTDGTKYFALPITAVGKYYFNPNNGCDKFYADVFLKFINRSYKDNDSNDVFDYAEYTQTRFGLGLGIGYKVASRKGIIFDIGFGVGRAIVDNTKFKDSSTGDDISVDWPEIMFQGKLGIGYRFGGK
ncbi:MAG: DUF3575 domain-containing protein [Bacteroidetes bacterium]|nr:DUF3575 domain-containing protein [Bacteroidota bacterium]